MQGQSRPHTKVVQVTFHTHVLDAFDAEVPARQRSRTLELLARNYVLQRRYGADLPESLRQVLALID